MKAIILKKELTTKDGKKQFTVYKIVESDGKLVDLRFKKDVDLALFKEGNKFDIECGYLQLATQYEYPRYYISAVSEVKKVK